MADDHGKQQSPQVDSPGPVFMQVGAKQPDDTIFAGMLYTGELVFVRPFDEPGIYTLEEASEHALGFTGHGSPLGMFCPPSKEVLALLYNNRELIGGFNETGENPEGRYLARDVFNEKAKRHVLDQKPKEVFRMNFADGTGNYYPKRWSTSSLRLVRGPRYDFPHYSLAH